jgi:hypothetical protein
MKRESGFQKEKRELGFHGDFLYNKGGWFSMGSLIRLTHDFQRRRKMKLRTAIIGILVFGFGLLLSTLSPAQTFGNQQWPVEINSASGKIQIYELQPETLQGNKLTGSAAVSLTSPGGKPVFGAIWFSAALTTDAVNRTYALKTIDVTRAKFPGSTPEQEKEFSAVVGRELPKHNLHGTLDALSAIVETGQKAEQATQSFQNAPPKIIFVKYPAVLLLIDGDPQLEAIENSSLMRVVNTPMLLVYDPGLRKYYLSSGSAWYSASNALGPWQIDHNPPSQVASIVTDNGQPVANNIPDNMMPQIIVSTVPAELIVSSGEPQYSAIKGTSLLYMSNTENEVLLDIGSQYLYVLLSGRWYMSRSLQGPWTYIAANNLPADFAKIPSNSDKGDVLVSVPGTEQAQDALIQSQIPQTAEVIRSEAQLTVQYDGAPRFEPINGTSMEYAVNTTTPVILVNGKYYACDNAVWFVAPTPNGPWVAADSIPREIQTIPADSPLYNVKYVYVYDSTPEVIYEGYTPGYIGWYPYYDTVVYGTGYYYPCWRYNHYYPCQWTFGFMPRYYFYPVFGWGFGYSWDYGFMTVGWGWNNSWRCHGWYGPGNYHGNYHGDHYYGHGQRQNLTQFSNVSLYRGARVGTQINTGNKVYKVDHETPRNIYSHKDNAKRIAYTPQDQTQTRPGNFKSDSNGYNFGNNRNYWQQKNNGNATQTQGGLSKTLTPQNTTNNVKMDKSGYAAGGNRNFWKPGNGNSASTPIQKPGTAVTVPSQSVSVTKSVQPAKLPTQTQQSTTRQPTMLPTQTRQTTVTVPQHIQYQSGAGQGSVKTSTPVNNQTDQRNVVLHKYNGGQAITSQNSQQQPSGNPQTNSTSKSYEPQRSNVEQKNVSPKSNEPQRSNTEQKNSGGGSSYGGSQSSGSQSSGSHSSRGGGGGSWGGGSYGGRSSGSSGGGGSSHSGGGGGSSSSHGGAGRHR